MKISREWATPLTIGAFFLMSVTGLLIFFHLDRGFNKPVHEWLGWALVSGAAAHAIANWSGFKRYFAPGNPGRIIIGLSALVLAVSFLSPPGGRTGKPPHVLAMNAVTKAPISAVAGLSGRTANQVMADLAKAGIDIPNAEASLDSIVGDDRELQERAMVVLFSRTASIANDR